MPYPTPDGKTDGMRRLPRWLFLVTTTKRISWEFLSRCILIRDNYICVYCLNTATEVDHVHAQYYGGKNVPYNLVAVCKSCNSLKQHRTLVEFFKRKFKSIEERKVARRRLGLARRRRIDKIIYIEKAKIALADYIKQEVQKGIARHLSGHSSKDIPF